MFKNGVESGALMRSFSHNMRMKICLESEQLLSFIQSEKIHTSKAICTMLIFRLSDKN